MPIIAQVHGYCLTGASEMAVACDLVYVADDAQIGKCFQFYTNKNDKYLYSTSIPFRK